MLFGSDGPWLHPGLELHKIRLLGLPPDQEALVMGGNILRLLRKARVGQSALEVKDSFQRPIDYSDVQPEYDTVASSFEVQSEQTSREAEYTL